MVRSVPTSLAAAWLCAALLPALRAQNQSASPRATGLKVTYAPLDPDQRRKEGEHSVRARVLSLCVERGEAPTPLIAPGMFEATFRGLLPLPVRDRYRFRVEGKGAFELHVNGEKVLAGTLRPGKPEETAQPVRLQKGDNEIVARIESSAIGEAQLRVSWSGAEFAFEPIAPDAWQWPADDADVVAGQQLQRGHELFVERRCARCHLPDEPVTSAYDELDHKGPDLRAVGARLQPGFLVEWLKDPRAVRPDATMPRFRALGERDVADVVAFLLQQGKPVDAPAFAAGVADRGAVRFLELGCIACHVPPEQSVDPTTLHDRIPLAFVQRKWRPGPLEQYLREPGHDQPHTAMPDFRLDAEDADALAAYLLRNAPTPGAAPAGDAEAGRRLAQKHGCDRCHDLPLPETGNRSQDLRALHADHGCLADRPDKDDIPDHGLLAADRQALRAFLPHAAAATTHRAPMDFAARNLVALRCTQCHALDGRASAWAQLVATLAHDEPLPPEQDPIAQGVPALTWVGSKLQPGWMERFVSGREPSPRPWLHARMPSFAADGPRVVMGLVRMHGYPAADEPEQPPDAGLALQGARLVKIGDGFGCVQCHGVGSTPPVQVFERQGVNFAVAAARLRRDYYMRWLLDPPRIDLESKMPKFADSKGKTPFTDVLDGDARRQFEAIWHWFRTLK